MRRDGTLHNGLWRSALLASDVSRRGKQVGTAIAEHGWTTGEIFPNQKRLAALSGTSPKTVQRAVDDLEAAGWLTAVPGSGRRSSDYTLTVPMPVDTVDDACAQPIEGGHGDHPARSPRPPSPVTVTGQTGHGDHRLQELPAHHSRKNLPTCPCGRADIATEGMCGHCRSELLAGDQIGATR